VAATLVYSHHQIYSEMFVVPVGALFAFTSIRANLPGAPDGFGKLLPRALIIYKVHHDLLGFKGTTLGEPVLSPLFYSVISGINPDMFSILPVLIIMSLCVSMASNPTFPWRWVLTRGYQSFALLLIVLYRRILQIPGSDRRSSSL
jgi:hypothetical protein